MPKMPIPSPQAADGRVVVVGSLNLDYVTQVEALPLPGEIVPATRLCRFRGGKGANQAIAAARQGSAVSLVGAVGIDEAGIAYLRTLEAEGIDISFIRTAPGETGSAFITVDREGENTIVIAPGANGELRRTDVARASAIIEAADILLGQFEIPSAPLVEAAHLANQFGVPVVINPSPFHPTFPWEEIRTDFLIVNETEVVEWLGAFLSPSAIREIAGRLAEMRAGHIIVTRGSEPTWVVSRTGEHWEVPVLPVLPIDTVGAGDAFAGCFAARIARGESMLSAVRAANCAGALTTLGAGAQGPIPDRDQVDRHAECLAP
ncbi:MAG TPA: ribokinase [Bacteroidia bacterium]|nr:ribokinase [Bacteroidia bacterium]